MITVTNLSKDFEVHKKAPGLMGSVKSLFWREKVVKEAVKSCSFQINEGEIVGLVGANGAGKTTLIKMLSGIIYPTAGKAEVLGYVPWERDNRLRRQMALIMGQKAQLWWDLPAADCFLLLKEIYRIDSEDFDKNLAYLTSVLDIKQEMNIQIRKLSLGERMKMELIAALLHRPRVVYLDEPTIGLDINAQRAIRDFLLQYRQEHKPAMILTSHYMEDIERMCERIIIIRQGEIVYDGRLTDVVSTYASHKVLTAHIAAGSEAHFNENELAKLGKIVNFSASRVQLHIPRREVSAAAGAVLSTYPVQDINIEEVDIGTIISEILKQRSQIDTATEDA
ncbi:ATP-binding cassette domain-containing protein [Planctomycetota bacterium]